MDQMTSCLPQSNGNQAALLPADARSIGGSRGLKADGQHSGAACGPHTNPQGPAGIQCFSGQQGCPEMCNNGAGRIVSFGAVLELSVLRISKLSSSCLRTCAALTAVPWPPPSPEL